MFRLRAALFLFLLTVWLARPAAADTLVGVAAPAQGQQAAIGSEMRRAAALAARQINADGGLLGQPIEIVAVDDGCTAEQAVVAAQDLIARGVTVVIGHPCASAAIAAAQVYAQAGVIFIAPITRHRALTEHRAGPTIFRLAGRDDRQAASAAAYLARTFPSKPLAVIYDGSHYAKQLADGVRAALTQNGVSHIFVGSVAGAQKDFAKLIAQLETAKIQAVYFAGLPNEAALLLKQMRVAGLEAAFMGSDTLATDQFSKSAGAEAKGALALLPYDPARAPGAQTLSEILPPHARKPLGPFVATFAAIEIWRAAALRAQSTAPNEVSVALQLGTFETVLGPMSFSESGDANVSDYRLVEWAGGAWRPRD